VNTGSGRPGRPLFTPGGAHTEADQLECALYGHDLEHVMSGASRQPRAAFCARGCGHPGWVMVPADQPRLWRSLAPVLVRALTPYPSALAAANAAVAAATAHPWTEKPQ